MALDINWAGLIIVVGIFIIYNFRNKLRAPRSMKKLGATTEGLILFTNLKNSYIVMEKEQKEILEPLFKAIINAEINSEYITALREALEKFEELNLSRAGKEEEKSDAGV